MDQTGLELIAIVILIGNPSLVSPSGVAYCIKGIMCCLELACTHLLYAVAGRLAARATAAESDAAAATNASALATLNRILKSQQRDAALSMDSSTTGTSRPPKGDKSEGFPIETLILIHFDAFSFEVM